MSVIGITPIQDHKRGKNGDGLAIYAHLLPDTRRGGNRRMRHLAHGKLAIIRGGNAEYAVSSRDAGRAAGKYGYMEI